MASEPYKTPPVSETATLWQKETAQPPSATPRPLPESRTSATNFALVNLTLRLLLFASALVGVLLMVTSRQTELVPIPIYPYQVPRSASFKHSPAFRYYVSALTSVGSYSLFSGLFSFFALSRPGIFDKFCRHIGASVAVSLIASILLTLLILFSIRFLSKKIPGLGHAQQL